MQELQQVTERRNEKLVRELGPLVASCLEDPRTEDVLLNPDGRVWVKRTHQDFEVVGSMLPAQALSRARNQFRSAGRGKGPGSLERLRHSDRQISFDPARIAVGWSLRLSDYLRAKSLAGHLDADHLPRWQLDQPRWNDGPGHTRNGRVSRQG